MKCNQLTTTLLTLGLSSLALGAAQQPGTPATRAQDARAAASDEILIFATASKLIGANVWSRANADGERADLADIKDFVVDAESGKIDFVILSSGGLGSLGDTLRRVPYSDLQFDHSGDECKVMLSLSEGEFGLITKIDDKSLEPYRAKTVAASLKDRHAAAREAGADKRAAGVGEAQMRISGFVLASELDDLDVRAPMGSYDANGQAVEAEKLGSIDEAWINVESGVIEYLTLEHKDRTLVIPRRALIGHVDAAREALYLVAPVVAARFAQAPALDEEKQLDLENAEFRRTVERFYSEQDGGAVKSGDAKRAGGSGQ